MPLLCLFTTQRPRGVFVKTVCAFETFDSAAVERMRGPCHLFVKRCLQLVRMCPEEARIWSVPAFFSAITPDQHVREAASLRTHAATSSNNLGRLFQ